MNYACVLILYALPILSPPSFQMFDMRWRDELLCKGWCQAERRMAAAEDDRTYVSTRAECIPDKNTEEARR